jgi:group I intron endonuclease
MGCIYRIFCKETGKSYIGQSIDDSPIKRYNRHWSRALKNQYKYALYNAMSKYGKSSFYLETLTICSKQSLDNLEAYYAEQYNSYIYENGYNIALCGRGQPRGYKHLEESRLKMRESKLGKLTGVMKEENKNKIGISNLGKKLTNETKEKISKSKIGKKQTNKKLEDEVVRIIRYNIDNLTHKELAIKYNTGFRTVSNIQRGISYTKVL